MPGTTSPDYRLTLEIVYCLGSCALAPVAVAPSRQGCGIGGLVVRACLRRAAPGLPVFVIGDPAFYERFGFEPAADRRVTSRFDVAPSHFMVRSAHPAPGQQGALGRLRESGGLGESRDPVERTLDYPAAFGGV
jgi:predicted N-acetyltransferase YhbS